MKEHRIIINLVLAFSCIIFANTQILQLNSQPKASFVISKVNNLQIQFDGSKSSDSDGKIVIYLWNFGDGNVLSGSDKIVSKTYSKEGLYWVSLTIIDDKFGISTSTMNIPLTQPKFIQTSNNSPPIPNFIYSVSGLAVDFDASSSSDSDGKIVEYRWSFGDGKQDYGPLVTHQYSSVGTYAVSLKVIDNSGLQKNMGLLLTIQPVKYPICLVSCQINYLAVNCYSTSKANPSIDINKSQIDSYYWVWGDGLSENTTSLKAVHTYESVKQFTVKLTIKDNDGSTSSCNTSIKTKNQLNNKIPQSSFSYSSNGTTLYTQPGGYDEDGNITKYEWKFGDGTKNSFQKAPIHQYATFGNYTVTLTVTDNGGAINSISQDIEIKNRLPYAEFSWSSNLTKLTLYPSSYDQDGKIVKYQWNFGDGSSNSIQKSPVHQYAKFGNYTVKLTVTDNLGATISRQYQIAIQNAVPYASFDVNIQKNVAITSTSSYDEDGLIIKYNWNWGDNTVNSTQKEPIHTYSNPGYYVISFTVIDNLGGTNTTSKPVLIAQWQ